MNAQEIEGLLTPLVEQEAAELVDLRYAKEGPRGVLRVFLDKEGGFSLDDCAYFSERIGSFLDSSKAIDRSYVLEVSSPGLDRVIKKEKDFQRFAGKAVKVRLKAPEQGQRNFHGVLVGFSDGKVLVDSGGKRLEFAAAAIDEARLDYHGEI
jgi:ribosome maturation factor RimP